jgi:hypothetical protein
MTSTMLAVALESELVTLRDNFSMPGSEEQLAESNPLPFQYVTAVTEAV